MRDLKSFILSFIAIICVAIFGSAFTSCTNDDELLVQDTQSKQITSFNQDSLDILTRGDRSSVEENAGWTLVMDLGSSYGYKLYRKTVSVNHKVYLQKVNLSMGAKLQFGFGQMSTNPNLPSSPYFKRKLLSSYWNSKPSKAISVTNCSHFGFDEVELNEVPTVLCFPVKLNGTLKTTGSYNSNSDKRKFGFSFSTQEAWISSFNVYTNDQQTIQNNLLSYNVICGYSPDRDEGLASLGTASRFMIGIKDQDNDASGKKEVLYLLTYYGTQSGAKQQLINVGCSSSDIIMLDGSGSAEMIAKNPDDNSATQYEYHKDYRTIPNVIYVCKP